LRVLISDFSPTTTYPNSKFTFNICSLLFIVRNTSLNRMNKVSSTARTVYLASDGFGQPLLEAIEKYLKEKSGIAVKNLGSEAYYDAAANLASTLQKDESPESAGILFCGTGMGVGIVANKFDGVRAAVCENTMAAKYSRAVNNANVLCLGKLITPPDEAKRIVDCFLSQKFIQVPLDAEGKPVDWWTENTEKFLSTSMDGISKVEERAKNKK
jgi:ribose 5-phosphate isomerase B